MCAYKHLDEGMRVLSREPLNVETSLGESRGVITPTRRFYHRNHFSYPDPGDGRIEITGAITRPVVLHAAHLLGMSMHTILVTLECAGNGRSGFSPPADGEPWEYGAVSTAEWTGVPLRDVLELADLQPSAVEILVEGADRGHVEAAGASISFARSLPLENALNPDVILAGTMNGEGINVEHGGPWRLIVPGWYGVASVKWVRKIEALTEPFRGFYQTARYVMPDGAGGFRPLSEMRVRSLITEPSAGAFVAAPTFPMQLRVRGRAWSGSAPIVRVEVSRDGQTWWEAVLASAEERYAWRTWEYQLEIAAPGDLTVMSRAFDALGNSQPTEPEWNRLGYANNAIQPIRLVVSSLPPAEAQH